MGCWGRAGAVLLGLLGGFGGAPAGPAGADPPGCGIDRYAPAIEAAARTLPALPGWPGGFTAEGAGNCDPCAALSAAVAIPTGGSAYAPVHILLFHDGRFVGTATPQPYRDAGIDDAASAPDTVVVGYHWPIGDECHACYRGAGSVRFRWVDGQVVRLDPIPAQAQPVTA